MILNLILMVLVIASNSKFVEDAEKHVIVGYKKYLRLGIMKEKRFYGVCENGMVDLFTNLLH